MNNLSKGVAYEDQACDYLKKRGFKILDRNVRYRFGEIDIVARKKRELVFIEVKGGSGFIPPRQRITEKKLRLIELAANRYMNTTDERFERCRLDVIEVLDNGSVNHIQGVGKW